VLQRLICSTDPVRLSADARELHHDKVGSALIATFEPERSLRTAAVAESSRSAIFLAEEAVIVYAPVGDSRPKPGPASVIAHWNGPCEFSFICKMQPFLTEDNAPRR